jgi:DNA-binding Xre family transcriptional regulator
VTTAYYPYYYDIDISHFIVACYDVEMKYIVTFQIMQAFIYIAILTNLIYTFGKDVRMEGFVNNVPAIIGKKNTRDNRRYSQVEIAEATGISQSMISRILTNRVKIENVAVGVLESLAEWLECDVRELYKPMKRNSDD